MLRKLLLPAAGIAAVAAIVAAPQAAAQPKLCDNHGTGAGQIYIAACATGDGGGGSYMWIKDEATGTWQKVKQQDVFTKPDTTSPPGE